MIYPENFEQKIEFDKIRLKLKNYCLSTLGASRVESMQFSTTIEFICVSLERFDEFFSLTLANETFPLDNVIDCRSTLAHLIPDGAYVDEEELFKLRLSIETIKKIYLFLKRNKEKYPRLWELAEQVKPYPYIESRLDNILTSQGKIKDNASSELLEIRRKIHKLSLEISKRMQSLLHQYKKEGIIEEEATLVIRDGKLLLPVNTTFKRKIKGFIYDESSTGKTTFIEPSEIIEHNNDLKELEIAERKEILKILIQIANDIRPYIPELIMGYDFLAEIDFIQAKVKFANDINAVKPSITSNTVIEWYDAIHPLLYLHLKEDNKEVVPLQIRLNEHQRILIISGPNAGGKSVCLKTVGLIQYMFQCGLPIPVKSTSDVGIFENIFLDLGDDQSIENDLSSYSSHLIHMKHFLKNANPKTLFLIDEMGSGTEPIAGGSIAESVLEELNRLGAYGVVTTHFSNLKNFASNTPGIINGAMLYDVDKLTPQFKLYIGEPGSSFAFEIAKKIGLPESVIQKASEKAGTGYIDFDRNLRQVIRDKHYWHQKRLQIKESAQKLENLIQRYGKELEEVNRLRKEIISNAKTEALQILNNANRTIENTIRTIKESQAEKEKTRKARENINSLKEQIVALNEEEERINRKIAKLKERELKKNNNSKKHEVTESKPLPTLEDKHTFKPGDKVKLLGQDTIGEVLQVNEKNVMVAFGNLITSISNSRIEKITSNEFKKIAKKQITSTYSYLDQLAERRKQFQLQLDVRGMRTQEALEKVTEYIDNAIILGISEVKILHGKGNGILRQSIREYLKTIELIEDFHDEHPDFGGAGITVVKFSS